MQFKFNIRFLFFFSLVLIELPLLMGVGSTNTDVFAIGIVLLMISMSILYKRDQLLVVIRQLINQGQKKFFWIFLFVGFSWCVVAIVKYFAVDYTTWDIGFFTHEILQVVKTGKFYSTILNRHALADHFVPNLLIFVPFLWIYPTILWLTFFQIAGFLWSSLILLQIGKRLIPEEQSYLRYVVPILFLIHSYFGNTLRFQLQPSTFSTPFILLAFLFAIDQKTIKLFVTLIFLIGFKEHLALVWLSVGMFQIFYQKQYKIGGVVFLSGLIVGMVVQFVLIPYFHNGMPSPHAGKFGPLAMIPEKAFLLILLFSSVGFLPLLSPQTLFFIIPAFAITLATKVPNMVTPNYHYQDIPLTVLFFGTLCGISALVDKRSWFFTMKERYQSFFAGFTFLLILLLNLEFVTRTIYQRWPTSDELALLQEVKNFKKELPQNINLWVDERLGPLFVDYPSLKSFDQWGGWQRAMGDKTPNIILTPKLNLSTLPEDQYQQFQQRMTSALSEKRYNTVGGYQQILVYQSVVQ